MYILSNLLIIMLCYLIYFVSYCNENCIFYKKYFSIFKVVIVGIQLIANFNTH